jgi:uracil-DNA glycosylase family 4
MAQDMKGFVPDEIVSNPKVTVWLQAPGAEEVIKGQPAAGATGDLLNSTLLPSAGLTRGADVSVCNTIRCRWNGSNQLPPAHILKDAARHCRVYDTSHDTGLRVASGSLAWSVFGQEGSVTDWRGFLAPNPGTGARTLCTLHPADLFRNPKMKIPMIRDWTKVKQYLEGTWPLEIPPFVRIPQDVSADKFFIFAENALTNSVPWVVIDTEFTRETRWLTVLGMSYPGCPAGVQIWFSELSKVDRHDITNWLRKLVSNTKVVFQNAMADVPVLQRNLGIRYSDYCGIEDSMLAHAVLWSDWPHTLEFLASMYGKYAKMKHLSGTDPSLYNWGDVIDTVSVWQGLETELKRDSLSASVYRSQSLPLIPIILKRMEKGIRVNKARVEPAILEYEEKLNAASRLAQASVGYPINVGSDDQLKHYLYNMVGLARQIDPKTKKETTDGDAIATLRTIVGPIPDLEEEEINGLAICDALDRIHLGADPVLESRVIYASAKQTLSHYLTPLIGKERIYPEFKIHAQASGRWSTTNPPLAQLPEDLRDIIIPDAETAWIAWDWDQIELRLLAALAQDHTYLDAFRKGLDVHTINARAIFQIPDAEVIDKSDIRRVFAKRFVYRLNYGGHPRGAGDIPGARQLGLTGSKLVDASNRYLSAHPAMSAWRAEIAATVNKSHEVRTWTGRRRRLLGDGNAALREAYNHPMQGGAADILNLTIINICAKLPYATVVYTMHDAATIEVPAVYSMEAMAIIKAEVEREWDIEGIKVSIPAKFKPILVGK